MLKFQVTQKCPVIAKMENLYKAADGIHKEAVKEIYRGTIETILRYRKEITAEKNKNSKRMADIPSGYATVPVESESGLIQPNLANLDLLLKKNPQYKKEHVFKIATYRKEDERKGIEILKKLGHTKLPPINEKPEEALEKREVTLHN